MTHLRIPLYDVRAETRWYTDELRQAFERVLAAGRFSGGSELAAFESELARYCCTDAAVGTKSGTDAIVLALRALGIGPGHEVITSAFTFIATAEAIVQAGATPVFCDIDPTTLCLRPEAAREAVTSRTRALLLVHLFGHSADMDAFASLCSERGITLVEDAAQSIGATWLGRRLGSLGRAGILSFYPTKNLSALGNAGALLTGDSELATRARMLASHGQSPDGRFTEAGFNSHLDELQAAFLRAKLAHLDIELARRRAIAARYDAELPFPPHPSPPIPIRPAPGCVSSYHQYAVRTSRRDALRRFLAEQGIGTGDYYRTPLHREPALAGRSRFTDLTETELACRETLTLPVRPSLSDDDVAAVVAGVQAFFAPRRPRPACPEPEPAAA